MVFHRGESLLTLPSYCTENTCCGVLIKGSHCVDQRHQYSPAKGLHLSQCCQLCHTGPERWQTVDHALSHYLGFVDMMPSGPSTHLFSFRPSVPCKTKSRLTRIRHGMNMESSRPWNAAPREEAKNFQVGHSPHCCKVGLCGNQRMVSML